ncbi:MAG TPA: ACP S-malonyltransferase [Solirubrobacteraceae bacterium]|nr:ACP S-malonyltransferase [Solirubrobacteraceae bacterium]
MSKQPTDTLPTVFLFPGQGAHTPDMRRMVELHAPDLCALCEELCDDDPFARAAESTRFAQPAIYCASLAAWRALAHRRAPLALAGHSLGELSALAAAGAITPADGLRLALKRGALMAEASERGEPQGMLALRAPSAEQLAEICASADLFIANRNSPRQVVLAGTLRAIAQAATAAGELGVRSLTLDVRGAYHTPLMASAVEPFAAALAQLPISEPKLPVYSCISAAPFVDIRRELARALTTPVSWQRLMAELWALGARRLIDVGPGQVLAGLARHCLPDAEICGPSSLLQQRPGTRQNDGEQLQEKTFDGR